MKYLSLLLICLLACKNNTNQNVVTSTIDTTVVEMDDTAPQIVVNDTIQSKVFSNARFKDVTVEKTGENIYQIKGKGQIFEASFNWVVEDGHDEIKKGFSTTDAGAPSWGDFNFYIDVKKQRENSTLTLILFESSAKDGSRQHELPITLE